MNRYLFQTITLQNGKQSCRVSYGCKVGTYNRKMSCNTDRQLQTRIEEIETAYADIPNTWSVARFANDDEARRYARETTDYLNS